MDSRIKKALCLICMLATLLAGCGKSDTPLKVAAHRWPGYELMFLAQLLDWLDPQKAVLVETSTAPESIELLKSGKVDAAALTLDEVLRVREEGLPLTVVLVFDESAGADVVLARPGMQSLVELRGKRIGVEHSAVGEVMLIKLLKAGGLTRQDVEVIDIAVNKQDVAWRQGELDAVVSYYPEVTELQEAGAVAVFDSRDVPGYILDVLAVRTEALEQHKRGIRHIIEAHFRGLAHLRKFPQDAGYRLADRLGVSGFDVASVYHGLKMPGVARNRDLLTSKSGLYSSAKEVNAILLEAQLVRTEGNYDNLINADYLPVQSF